MGSFAALWISMSACVPTYMLASSLVGGGMNWRQAVLTIFLGNAIVLVPILLNAHAGTRYGIPFPVLCRASFGTVGANLPALLRALVACGWFGIQSWIGGEAIHKILSVFFPEIAGGASNALGVTLSQFLCFIAFWSLTSSRSKRLKPLWPGFPSGRAACAAGSSDGFAVRRPG
jgi:NCS1 family nucleobase:cation symporter-1